MVYKVKVCEDLGKNRCSLQVRSLGKRSQTERLDNLFDLLSVLKIDIFGIKIEYTIAFPRNLRNRGQQTWLILTPPVRAFVILVSLMEC